MAYYNRDKAKLSLKLDELEFLNSEEYAKVRYNSDIIFKEYYHDSECRLTTEMFDILKNIDNSHFMKIYEIYSEMNTLELAQYILKQRPFIVDAYIAKYYPEEQINVLYESIDYLLDNFNELEILFKIFSYNGIVTDDVKRTNTVLNKNEIIIIDPDAFYTSKESQKDILIRNKKELLYLFKSILLDSAKKNENCKEWLLINTKFNSYLTDFEIEENTNITKELSKRLGYVKRPIDYFIK